MLLLMIQVEIHTSLLTKKIIVCDKYVKYVKHPPPTTTTQGVIIIKLIRFNEKIFFNPP